MWTCVVGSTLHRQWWTVPIPFSIENYFWFNIKWILPSMSFINKRLFIDTITHLCVCDCSFSVCHFTSKCLLHYDTLCKKSKQTKIIFSKTLKWTTRRLNRKRLKRAIFNIQKMLVDNDTCGHKVNCSQHPVAPVACVELWVCVVVSVCLFLLA